MKKTYIEEIRERDPINSVFLVRDKNMAMAKNGKPYMNLKIMDRSGEVDGRIWDRVDELNSQFDKDDFVHVKGKANLFMGKMQFIISSIERVDEQQINLGDFLPVSANDPQEMRAEMQEMIARIADPDYRRLLEAFSSDEEFMRLYLKAPAAKSMHHVYLGGLLEHSLCVARLAQDVSARYPRIDRDLLLCSALLHDIGKVAELRYARSFDYTDAGKLIGHIVMGVEMLEEKIRTCPGFPPQKTMLLKHMLLSHHGQYEYGSPKRPKTLEAVVLNFVDDMDAKINGIALHIDREQHNPSEWTSYHRLYDRYFYAPAHETGKNIKPAAPSAPEDAASAPAPTKDENKRPTDKRQSKTNKRYQDPLRSSLGDQLAGATLDLFENREDGEK
ncbi:MAG: 3'-5' exoribonuclease YhaM family protein [Thermodesulfobacteriota bacterium]